MSSSRHPVVRWLLALVVLAAAGIGFYSFRRDISAERVRAEMMAIIGDMDLPPEWREQVDEFVMQAHESAFRKALDVTRRHGRKFDAQRYYDEVMNQVIGWLREDGKNDIGDRLETDRPRFSLHTTER